MAIRSSRHYDDSTVKSILEAAVDRANGVAQELTVTGTVTADSQFVELNHASVAVVATVATSVSHGGIFCVKDTSATGTAAHICKLTVGTFDGTNNTATLNARDEALVVWFDSAGRGTIIVNVGSVALSST